MAIITRTIENISNTFSNITLQVPGYDTAKLPIVITYGATLDLFTVITGDQLEAIQPTLDQYVLSGQLAVIATVDTATFNPVGGSSGVSSLNSLTGAVTLAAGSNISITPSSHTLTIASTGGGSGITQLTGDVTAGPGSGSEVATLATVNPDVGSFTNANITVNAKGLITMASNGSGGGGTPGGTNGAIQYNESGAFQGSSNFTFLTAPPTLIISDPTDHALIQFATADLGIVSFNNADNSFANAIISGAPGSLLTFGDSNNNVVRMQMEDPVGLVIGKNSLSIPEAAILCVNSTSQGFLPPRMSQAQKEGISSPVAGLVVYDTTLNALCVYTGSGSDMGWATVTAA